MLLAADYPFLDVVWTIVVFFAWVVWFWMMIMILTDVFGRHDIGGWSKAAWTVFLIVLPFVGALIYLIAQHDHMAERRMGAADRQRAAIDDRIRSVAGGSGGGAATEIAEAKRLLDDGTIDQAEFQKLKQAALA